MEKPDLNELNDNVIYKTILRLSEEMMDAAERENWDGIIVLEKNRRVLIDHLRKKIKPGRPHDKGTAKTASLIQKILSADTQTKRRTKERIDYLRSGFETERRLLKTYSNYATSA